MTELFDNLPESKSPRLLWMERHEVKCERVVMLPEEPEPYSAWTGDSEESCQRALEHDPHENVVRLPYYCTGETEHGALVNIANVNGWKLWNEEGATQ